MRMMLLVGVVVLLAGCADPAAVGSSAVGPLADATITQAELIERSTQLGWVVAAGAHQFAGDTIVGVKSHEQCPAVSFVVPAHARDLHLTVGPGAGVGAYKIAFSWPGGVAYASVLMPAPIEFEEAAPVQGIWRVEAKPEGAVVQQTWALAVGMDASAEEVAGDESFFVPDSDCLL